MTTTTEHLLDMTVNGTRLATRAATLAALVVDQGFAEIKVATAVNGDFVAERMRAATVLNDGDRVEIVSVRQGG